MASGREQEQPHFVVEFLENVHTAADYAERAIVQISKSAAIRAFRHVEKDKDGLLRPIMNRSGNLRGIAINKRAGMVFRVSSNLAEKFAKYDHALIIAGFLIELSKDTNKFKVVYNNTSPNWVKSLQYFQIANMAFLRSVSGFVPDIYHVVAFSLESYCEMGARLSGKSQFRSVERGIMASDVKLELLHKEIFSPEFFQKVAGIAVSPLIDIYFSYR